MSILRDDVQVALNSLHVAIQESADYYRSVAETLEDARVTRVCREIARQRDELALEVAAAIRDTGDLPAEPDRDREAAVEIRERLAARVSANQVQEIVRHRRESENDLLGLFEGGSLSVLQANHNALLKKCRNSVEQALDLLASM